MEILSRFAHSFALSFIPLFIAIDIVGLLPVYIALTVGMSAEEKRGVVRAACVTGLSVSAGFVLAGEGIFRMLGITSADFRIAGGFLLLVFAVQDLTIGGKPRRAPSPTLAVVPLGMPLIVGPGVLTTSLLLVQQQGYLATLASLLVNLAIVFLALSASERILRVITPAGAAAAAKIASLLLAAIGVMMLRVGVEQTIRQLGGS
ncbi:MAG: MarC family protein [Planctomycetota bacterium]